MNIHFKTAKDYIRRSPFQAMAAIFVLAISFFISTILGVLVYSSNNLIKYFETRPQIIAFLKEDADLDQINTLKKKLEIDDRISELKYVSKDQALAIYKEATSDNPLLSELVSPDIFPSSLEFSLKDLSYTEKIVDELKGEQIVEDVGFTANLGSESGLNDVVQRLRTITWYIRVGGLSFVSVLLGTSFLVLIIIIGIRMTMRRGEVEILDLIGATPGFIRSPIVLEALIYAFFGVFLGWVGALTLVLYATPTIVAYFGEIPVLPKNTNELLIVFGIMFAVELFIGVVLALMGSFIAVSRSVRSKTK